ncbi:MAG: hypothetical protein VX367_12510, partial [SAR324 cluster bacterium]|nr:hypothetical protein [SAR324 cluster bacterium]
KITKTSDAGSQYRFVRVGRASQPSSKHNSLSNRHKKLLTRSFSHFSPRADGRTDGRTDGWTDGRTDGWMDGWMDGRADGRTDRRMDGRTDERTDGQTDEPSLL